MIMTVIRQRFMWVINMMLQDQAPAAAAAAAAARCTLVLMSLQ
jgi:hypothetical protein